MNLARKFFPTWVLPNGTLFVVGGEYTTTVGLQTFDNSGEFYDPVTNSWSPTASHPESLFGDVGTEMLQGGKILAGSLTNANSFLFDPVRNSWSRTGVKLRADRSDEESWCILPDGTVLSYDVFASPAKGAGTAQRYIPTTGKWVNTGPVPVPLSDVAKFGAELGPMILLPTGNVFLVGANNNTVIYFPASDTWRQGPSLPAKMGCDDAPGAVLPNGHVLFIADSSDPNLFSPPSRLFDRSAEIRPHPAYAG